VTARPEFDGDLCTDAAIGDPHPLYLALRDLGPTVWLRAHDAWAIARLDALGASNERCEAAFR
jgi:hypothetical protein